MNYKGLIANEIIEGIWDDMDDRAGINLDSIDDDIQQEITEAWRRIVIKAMEDAEK